MNLSEAYPHSIKSSGLFSAAGEMASLIRSLRWSETPLGPVESWPASLRIAVSICLDSLYPMLILWGPDYIQIYNDAYRPVLGATKHPRALGQRARECWPEIWDNMLSPMFGQVMAEGKAIWNEDLLFLLDRNGYLEETYFTFSYSPIRDETGQVGGILVTCVETTQRYLGERRLKTLRRLAEQTAEAKTAPEACQIAARMLNPADTPFALIYLLDEKGQVANLMATARLDPGTPASPHLISLDRDASRSWPIASVIENNRVEPVPDLSRRFGSMPGGPWPEPSGSALVLPILAQAQARPTGILIAGTSPRRALDDDYRSFYQLVAGQVATAVANARAYEAERKRAEALAELDRAKTAFFSNVSHEFRTPLTPLLGPLEDLPSGSVEGMAEPLRAQLELARVREESNRRITNILESITDGFIALDTEWRYTYINRAAQRAFERLGKSPEKMLGQKIWEEMPELVGTFVEEQYRRAVREQRPLSFEYYYPQVNTWFDIHVYPSSEGLSIYFGEVTDRKHVATSLARLADIVESSDDAIISKNLDGIIQSWNPGAERIFGYRAQEVLGQPISIIYPPDHIDEFPRIMARLRAGERLDHYETVRRRKDGTLINVSVSISPLRDAAGHIVGASKIARDITERKRAEEAQRFLGEATELLASSLDYETTLKSVARLAVPRLADWCIIDILDDEGRLRELEVAHRDPDKVKWGWELRKRYPLDLNMATGAPHVVRTGEPELFPEITGEMLAGAARTGEDLDLFRSIGLSSIMIVPLIARGRTLGAIELVYAESGRHFGPADLVFAQELARRAALAVDNARLYREAQEAVHVREQFLSIASHELRTPLTSIYGYTQLLERLTAKSASVSDRPAAQLHLDRERFSAYLHKLERECDRLTRLISELLDVSRLRQDRLALDRERIDLSVLVSTAVDMLRQQQEDGASASQVLFQLELPVVGAICGACDSSRLEQVVQNLLNNAVKYSPHGGTIQVGLTVEPAMGEGRTGTGDGTALSAHLMVRDQGIGIPREQQPQLFQPFFRATNAAAGHFGGLGLGLAICKGIVEAHGGRIWVESEGSNLGTTFHVVLPGVESDG